MVQGVAESDMELDMLGDSESDSEESTRSHPDNASIQRSAITAATAGSDAGRASRRDLLFYFIWISDGICSFQSIISNELELHLCNNSRCVLLQEWGVCRISRMMRKTLLIRRARKRTARLVTVEITMQTLVDYWRSNWRGEARLRVRPFELIHLELGNMTINLTIVTFLLFYRVYGLSILRVWGGLSPWLNCMISYSKIICIFMLHNHFIFQMVSH